ncbi:hypothetical protein 1 [Hubei diptera virus 14]|uniref:hypothetical protein 1 n=1 Tax=Hubei diptera virus 14 TaxID=1922875 RepID=UPI00090A6CE1|nr:hypothetical protein 1 [Hubei diptera virus 14]APG75805.1 hypothetical protein 1 [Hubei diptera virus 14]
MKTCPVCQRKFVNKQALKQHMDSAHGKPAPVRRTKNNINNMIVSRGNDNDIPIRIKRKEFIQAIDKTNLNGNLVFNPRTAASSKILNKFAKIYDNYIVHSCSVQFVSGSRSTRNGMVVVAVDYGSSSIVTNTKENLYALPSVATQVHSNSPVLKISVSNAVRYCNVTDKNRDNPFTIYWYCDTTETDGGVGDLFLTYDIEFKGLTP